MPSMQVRYEAEWITRQHRDSSGEWNPDLDEYASEYRVTLDSAIRLAVRQSKATGQCEWWRVTEQRLIGHHWVDSRRWSGDWEGNIDENGIPLVMNEEEEVSNDL